MPIADDVETTLSNLSVNAPRVRAGAGRVLESTSGGHREGRASNKGGRLMATTAHERKKVELRVVRKIHRLSPDLLVKLDAALDRLFEEAHEAEDLVLQEFGRSHAALASIWDNPDDAEYDRL